MNEIGEVLEVILRKSPHDGGLGFSIRGGRDRPCMKGTF